jgi:4-hydroxybenzoate polyprenyltransferase
MRPRQWVKNFFIFLPAFFMFKLNDINVILTCAIAFAAFSLCASGVYVFNDIRDAPEDRLHKKKRFRPIASGKIAKKSAVFLSALLTFLGCGAMLYLSLEAFIVLAFYVVLNVAYTIKLKHIAVIDIIVIAIGFIIRLQIGSIIVVAPSSHWIIVMTFLLALFLAFAKRRDELLILTRTGAKTRKNLDNYNLQFVDNAMVLSAGVVILAYILWSISPITIERIGSQNVYMTGVFVLYGVLRYMQLCFVEENSGDPSLVLLSDRPLQLSILCWVASFAFLLYMK